MAKKIYTSPKVISHQVIKFETLISGSPEEPEEPTDPVEPIIPLIDIKPGSDPSSFGANSKGSIPVALMGSANFDVSNVDNSTVRFGDRPNEGALPSPNVGIEDVNNDGYMDKVYHFPFQQTNLDPKDKIGYLSGKINGENFVSSSDVNIVGGNGKNGK
jgi:hypothetical protein